ncbi:BA14K family protein [Nitratireductor luteus]|uniref:BA14K family protein n=1 Tax=Nitratireductor luteus TaxID=2976980 RepID=UPI00223F2DF1|nr:BA14K family protein [Nitratireductor luteus]
MRHRLSTLTFSGLVALGIMAGSGAANASALSVAGTSVDPVRTTADTANPSASVQKVHDRRYRHGRKRHFKRRHDKPRMGIYFEFGTGGYRYRPPYYARPHYARPYYVRPRPERSYRLSRQHVSWCYDRYRSYRAYDNTFQPYNGPRRACRSPYMY